MDPVRNMARLAATSMAMVRPIATPVRRRLRPMRASRSSNPILLGRLRLLLPIRGITAFENVKVFSRHNRSQFLDPKLIQANEGSWILGFEAIPKIKIDRRAVFRKLPAVTLRDIRR